MPKVSVIIPVYNAENYLRECLDSVLAQTFTDFEVLLINDGSTDASGKICDEYAEKDPRVKVLHKENGGVSVARNLGISKSNGDWIAFIDSDDEILENYLRDLIYDIDNKEIDLVFQGLKKIKNGIALDICFEDSIVQSTDYESLFNIIKIVEYGYPFSKLYKKDKIIKNRILFPEKISISEDLHFLLHYISHTRKIKFSSKANYLYNKHLNSLSTTKKNAGEYFQRYMLYKKIIKNFYIEVYNNLLIKFPFLTESIASTLVISIESLYIKKENFQNRMSFYRNLMQEDLQFLDAYNNKSSNLFIFKFIYFLIVRRQYKLADFLQCNYYLLKSVIKKGLN